MAPGGSLWRAGSPEQRGDHSLLSWWWLASMGLFPNLPHPPCHFPSCGTDPLSTIRCLRAEDLAEGGTEALFSEPSSLWETDASQMVHSASGCLCRRHPRACDWHHAWRILGCAWPVHM